MSSEDPANLVFSARTDRRPKRPKTSDPVRILTYVFCAVALVALLLMVGEILARGWRSANVVPNAEIVSPPDPVAEPFAPTPVERTARVFRCVARSGAVSFQSRPCAPGERTTVELDATPDSASEIARARQRQRQASRSAAAMARIAGTDRPDAITYNMPASDELAARRASCAAAKESREATLRAVGLRRTYELLQQLDAAVYEACKGL